MSFDLTIRSRRAGQPLDRERVIGAIEKLPAVSKTGPGQFQYQGRDPRLRFELYAASEGPVEAVEIVVPAANSAHATDLAMLGGFQLADVLGCELHDEQTGAIIGQGSRQELLNQRRKFGRTPLAILKRAAEYRESLAQAFVRHFMVYEDKWFYGTVFLSAVLAGVIVVRQKLPLDTPKYFLTFWIMSWVVLTALRSLTLAVLRR